MKIEFSRKVQLSKGIHYWFVFIPDLARKGERVDGVKHGEGEENKGEEMV